jgi:hypothetical protein
VRQRGPVKDGIVPFWTFLEPLHAESQTSADLPPSQGTQLRRRHNRWPQSLPRPIRVSGKPRAGSGGFWRNQNPPLPTSDTPVSLPSGSSSTVTPKSDAVLTVATPLLTINELILRYGVTRCSTASTASCPLPPFDPFGAAIPSAVLRQHGREGLWTLGPSNRAPGDD